MARFMLDSDIASYIMKRSNEYVLRRLRTVPVDDVCISAISKSELFYGVEVSPNRQRDQQALDELMRHVLVLDYPEASAAHYGQIRSSLKLGGNPIGANDLFIAAHARSLQLTLVTNNVREFSRVDGLKIENWAAPSI